MEGDRSASPLEVLLVTFGCTREGDGDLRLIVIVDRPGEAPTRWEWILSEETFEHPSAKLMDWQQAVMATMLDASLTARHWADTQLSLPY